jgi:hypothetical protein
MSRVLQTSGSGGSVRVWFLQVSALSIRTLVDQVFDMGLLSRGFASLSDSQKRRQTISTVRMLLNHTRAPARRTKN